MKSLGTVRARLAVLLLLLPVPSALCQQAVPGLRYERRTPAGPLSIHILVVDPQQAGLIAERALNDGVGRETVSSMAERKNALAAVNGGFFRIGGRYDGEPEGILKIGGRWYSDPAQPRGAIGWRGGGQDALIGRLRMRWFAALGTLSLPLDGINRPRGDGEVILYNWAFHRTTLTNPGGIELAIAGNRSSGMIHSGDASIPPDGVVVSIGPKSTYAKVKSASGTKASIRRELMPAEEQGAVRLRRWQAADYIVGGVPVLLTAGKVPDSWEEEKMRPGFAEEKHPRTAVGLRGNGEWVFLVVDGRQPEISIGMTLLELAGLMKELGCVEALNLDGGGSSTMVLNRRVVNSPSDAGKERPVSDAILVVPK